MTLLIEPFKNILNCHWLIFSTDSQRGVFVNTAFGVLPLSVYYFERLACEKIYYFYERSESSDDLYQFAIVENNLESLRRLYMELEKNIDASRTNSVDELLSGEVSAIWAETSPETLAQRATFRTMFEIRKTKLALQ
jgi:hypothetical protein